MGSYLEQAIARLKEFEGSVPWMYLDTVGKVTVGVGLMLPDAASAAALPFLIGDRRATTAEIEAEFARVSRLAKGKAAGFYRKSAGLRLSEEAIADRLRGVLEGMEGYLRTHVPGYESLPEGVKLALLDMVYNLGPGRLFHQYPKLMAAIESGDWKRAASMSARRGPGQARNEWTKEQFLLAAKQIAIKAEADIQRAASGGIAPLLVGIGALLLAVWAARLPRSGSPGAAASREF